MNVAPTVLASRLLARARLRHLQVLVRLADLGSFSRTAQAVGLTQPAVTHVLAELERLLETRLFERNPRGVTPTGVGQAILPEVRRMLESIDKVADIAAAFHRDTQSILRIGAISGAVSALLADAALGGFSQRFGILVELQEGDIDEILDWLARGAIDIALVREPRIMPTSCAFEPLLADRFVVVCANDHPLASQAQVTTADLWRHPWLLGPLASAPRRVLEQWLAQEGATVEWRSVATRSMAITWALLREQPLLCLIPQSIAHSLLAEGQLVQLPVEVPFPIEPLGILSPQGEPSGPVASFAAHLRELQTSGV